jgi:hypothetical protein
MLFEHQTVIIQAIPLHHVILVFVQNLLPTHGPPIVTFRVLLIDFQNLIAHIYTALIFLQFVIAKCNVEHRLNIVIMFLHNVVLVVIQCLMVIFILELLCPFLFQALLPLHLIVVFIYNKNSIEIKKYSELENIK